MRKQRQAVQVRQDQSFKGRQFAAEVILWAVRRHLMFPVSYRDLELMLLDCGVEVDHITIFRWIHAYAAEPEKLIRPHLHMSNGSWRVDETYVTVKGPVDVSASRHRQPRPDHRLPVVGQARHCGSEAVLPQGIDATAHCKPAKRLACPELGFGSFWTARRTLAGYETMARIRKGQVRNIDGRDITAQARFIATYSMSPPNW